MLQGQGQGYGQGPPIGTGPPGVDVDTIINSLTPLVLGIVGLVVAGVVLYRLLKSDLVAAITERIRAGVRGRRPEEAPTEAIDGSLVVELQHNVIEMRGQIAELAERLDFAERLLAQKRERSLPGA